MVFIWIPSHNGNFEKEKEDQALNLARNVEATVISKIKYIATEDWIHRSKKKLFKTLETMWKNKTI